MDDMKEHFIVAGIGTVGKNVVQQLRRAGRSVVCIDNDPAVFEGFEDGEFVVGEATRTEVLEEADISGAGTLVACAGTDAINAFIILEARSLNPDISILTRAEKNENVDKLYMAGADHVMPLVGTAGRMLVRFAVAPHISEFVDRIMVAGDLEIANSRIPEGHPIAGKTLKELDLRQKFGITVLAIMKEDGLINTSSADLELAEKDILVFIGKAPGMIEFLEVLHPRQ